MTKTKRKPQKKAVAKTRTRAATKAKTPPNPLRHVRVAGYVFVGAAVLSVALLTALFVDFRTLPGQMVDTGRAALRSAGLKVDHIDVRGANRFTYRQIAKLARVNEEATIFGQDLAAIQERLEKQTWIQSVRISRHLPDRLTIDVNERKARARWQQEGKFYLIGADGTPFMRINSNEWRDLPVVVGNGANRSAQGLYTALEDYPYLSSRLLSATWIGERRWDLLFEGGVLVRLPEEAMAEKLGQLSRMQMQNNIFASGPMRIDMRMDHMLAISTDPDEFTPKPRPRRGTAQSNLTAS